MQRRALCKVMAGIPLFTALCPNLLCIISEDYFKAESQESNSLSLPQSGISLLIISG